MQQIYARIKRTSKYYRSQHNPEDPLFPVVVAPQFGWEYCVHGGPGGHYRRCDVKLFIKDDAGKPCALW